MTPHDLFSSMPWLAWPAVALLVLPTLSAIAGEVIGKLFRGVPWWAGLGLIGILAGAWQKGHRQSDPWP